MAWLLGLYRAVLRSWMAWAGGLTIKGQPSPFAAAMAWRTAADAVIPTAGGSEFNDIAMNAPQRMQSNRIESNRPKGAAKRLECLDGLVCDKPPSLDDSDLADETELRRSPTEFRRAAVGRLGPLHSLSRRVGGRHRAQHSNQNSKQTANKTANKQQTNSKPNSNQTANKQQTNQQIVRLRDESTATTWQRWLAGIVCD